MKIIIKIQSFGDIITNSSSETFCTITGSDVNKILEILKPLFCEFHYCDMYPTVEYYEKGEYTDDSPALVAVSLPQGFDMVEDFYKARLKAILDATIGSENYSINYEMY